MSRDRGRSGRRFHAETASGGGPVPRLGGVSGIDSNTRMETTVSSGCPGDTGGFYVALLFRNNASPGAGANLLINRIGSVAPFQGWRFTHSITPRRVGFTVSNAAGLEIESATVTNSAVLTDGRVQGFVGVYSSVTGVQLYANNAAIGAPTVSVGYTPAPTGLLISGTVGGNASTGMFFGATYGVGVPSLANVQAWFANTKAAFAVQDMPSFPPSRKWVPGTLGDNVTDSVGGSVVLTKQGTGHGAVADAAPVWAW